MININFSKKMTINEKGGAILGTVFLMSALAFLSIIMLLQNTEQTKINHVKSIKKKSFELIVDNLKTKFSNPHVCAAAFRGRRLDNVFKNISEFSGFLTSMIDQNDLNPNTYSFNSSKNGFLIGGLIIAPPPTLPPMTIDPMLPGFDNSLILFESLSFDIINNSPNEIFPDYVETVPAQRGVFSRTGAGAFIPLDEVNIRRFKANVNLVANVGIFGKDFYVSNLKNEKPGSVFTTEYVRYPNPVTSKLYPKKVYRNGSVVLQQVPKGNPTTGYTFHWTEDDLKTMGITNEKQQLEIPLYFYVKTTPGSVGEIVDCFTDDSPARICELSGGIWRSRNPVGYECEPRNKCLTSEVIYAPTIAVATSQCPMPFKNPLKVGVAMNETGSGSDPAQTSYLCRWCNTNRY
jgi:hypothetical protein